MIDDIRTFFDQFVIDFPSFDGELIASRYHAPYLAVSSDGDILPCNESREITDYMQGLLDRHSSDGVVRCFYEDLVSDVIGSKCASATVSWTMVNAEDKVISHWRESYNLLKTDAGLKIFTSIDH